MVPEDLAKLITSLSVAADIVDAIDDPSQRKKRGWNVTGWSYEFVPWGICFLHRSTDGPVTGAVVASALPEAFRERIAGSFPRSTWPTILLMLG